MSKKTRAKSQARLSRCALRHRSQGRPAAEALESRLLLSVNVLTYHYDTASTGVNYAETQLTPSNVKVGSFGKLFTTAVDGQIYAEPLVYTGVTIAAGPNTTAGSSGAHDVVFVATEHDSLYAVDASVNGGAVLWKRSFLDTSVAANNTLNASSITPVPFADVISADVSPELGITGTPVIDAATNTLYVVTKTKETIGGADHYVQRLHAINIADGNDRVTPYLIGDTTNGNTNNTSIYVYGTGDGAVTDPYNGTGRQVVQFNALRAHQRGALSLVNGTVYIEWASHGDNGPYHGWVAAWDVTKLSTAGLTLKGVLNTAPNGGWSGVWGGGGRLAFESNGSAFYFETGNGPTGHGNPVLDANGFPADGSYYEALIKAVADPTTSPAHQNMNGWGFKVADYFIPYNQVALDNADRDFGSSAPMILPDSAGVAGHPHLIVASGKEGKIYLVDRDNMGKFDPNNDHVVNAVANGSGNNTPPVQIGGALSTAAFYNGSLYYTSGYSSTSNAYRINADGTLTQTSQTPEGTLGYLPASVTVSANGNSNGVVWITDRNTNTLRAYDSGSMANELWNSGQKAAGADNVGAVVKFAVPTVANGELYVGTSAALVVFGLTPPARQAPSSPVLSATALSGSAVNLTWTDATLAPNLATGYLVEQSVDGTAFTQVTTAPAGASSLSVGGLSPGTKYYFRICGQNGVGSSGYSNVSIATTSSQLAVLDFSTGFSSGAAALRLNGSSAINGSKLELTSTQGYQSGSAFSSTPVDVTKFSTQFSFQLTAGSATADGFTFCIQNVGSTALGALGGYLGYAGSADRAAIGNSIAVKFDLYNNSGEGVDSTGLYVNGAVPMNTGSIDLAPSGLDLHSGDVFQVVASYDGNTLSVTIGDTSTGKSATQNYAVNIPSIIGGGTAFVGFTAGTGGLTATQDILRWTFSPNAAQAPNAPSALGAVAVTGTSINLAWTSNAVNQSGFRLDRATDLAFTQNLVTQNLPAAPSNFTDTAIGLAPGSTFYYRLRAFNTAGDSASSNVATVSVPVAPAKPSNAVVENVTSTSIDLNWTDNAGSAATAYLILRRIGSGTFVNYASLPPTSGQVTPPSTYDWTDTGLTPGTPYEYHIEAVNTSGYNDFVGANASTLTAPPPNLIATATANAVNLSWAAPSGAVQYSVYRGTSAGNEGAAPLATGITSTHFSDTSASAGVKYYYTVTAINVNINHVPPISYESAASNEASGSLGVAPAAQFADPSFEAVNVGGSYAYDPASADWGFTGGAGVEVNGSSWGAASAPDGKQAAFLQGGASSQPGIISQTVSFSTGGSYQIAFAAAQRSGYGVEPIVVAMDGAAVATITPGSTSFQTYSTPGFNVGAGKHAFTFSTALINAADIASFIDNVKLVLVAGDTQAPTSPTGLAATAVLAQSVSIGWTAATDNIGVVGYTIYRGSSPIGSVGGSITTFTDTSLTAGTAYVYTVVAFDAAGNKSPASAPLSITTPAASPTSLDFSSGFGAAAVSLSLNGSATINGTKLELTNGGSSQAGSAFTRAPLNVAAFSTQFAFQLTAGQNTADGFTFAIQGGSSGAIGGSGGALGFGPNYQATPLAKSVAIKFDLFNNDGEGNDSTGIYLNGLAPTSANSIDLSRSGVDLHSGDIFQVNMTYDGTLLAVTIKDTKTGQSQQNNYAVNIPSTVGGSNAYVGFTAGTGGLSATQDILNWSYNAGASSTGATAAPAAPVLTATTLTGSSINLSWADSSIAPNTATSYVIEQSTDGNTFIGAAVAGSGTTSLAISGLTPGTKYYFRMRGLDTVGASINSNVASATTSGQAYTLDFSGGFAASGSKLQLNGSAGLNGSRLSLTNGGNSQAASVFTTSAYAVAKFSTQFSFQLTAGQNTADGFTFTIQGVAPTALGNIGGALGYGSSSGGAVIGKSVAIKFDLFNNAGEGNNSTGLYTNGANPTSTGSVDLTPSGVDLHSGDLLQANMSYDGVTLAVTIKDTATGKSFTKNYTVNIPTIVGASTAFLGFTAGTGGLTATQEILNWTFSNT